MSKKIIVDYLVTFRVGIEDESDVFALRSTDSKLKTLMEKLEKEYGFKWTEYSTEKVRNVDIEERKGE